MIGEKFVERKIEDNKVIIINEFKDFPYDYEQIAIYINDYVTDDYENLASIYGVYLDWEDYYSIDCDLASEGLNELLLDREEENKEGEEWDNTELKEYIKKLDEAEGYTIYFKKPTDYYTKGFKVE